MAKGATFVKLLVGSAIAAVSTFNNGGVSATDNFKVDLIPDSSCAMVICGSQFQQVTQTYQFSHRTSIMGAKGRADRNRIFFIVTVPRTKRQK